jgi:Anaphase promoting complex subunit 8 / Cdc23
MTSLSASETAQNGASTQARNGSLSLVQTEFRAAEALNSMDMETTDEGMPIDASGGIANGKQETELEMRDLPKYLLGKSYFDCKEYERAASALRGSQSLKSKFLRLYSRFLVMHLNSGLTIVWREKKGR